MFSFEINCDADQGYVRGKNLHGAPYDFRRAANEHGEYFDRLKNLVEETYTKEILSASQDFNFKSLLSC